MITRNVGWMMVVGLALAGCGGGGSGSSPAPAAITNGTTGTIGSGVPGTLSLAAANGTGTSANKRAPKFISPGAISAGVSINGGTPVFADVSAGSTLCISTAGVRTCTIAVAAPAGTATFAVSLYSAANGGGSLLSSGTGTTTVVAGTAFTVPIAMNAVVGGLASNNINNFTVGTPAQATFAPVFSDPAGQSITGSAPYLHPVAITLNSTHVTFTPASLTAPGQSVTVAYDGSAAAPSNVMATIATNGVTIFTGTIPVNGLFAIRYNLGPIGGGGAAPQQLVVGPDNNIWWAEQSTNMIGRINPAAGASSITHFATGFGTGAARGIAKGGDGNIWYSNGGLVISRMTTSGGAPGTGPASITVSAAGGQVTELATDSQGNVWYLNVGGGFSQVAYVDMTTFAVHTFGPTLTANALGQSSHLTLGADHAMWYTENNGTVRNIGRITTPANGTAGTYAEFAVPLSGPSVLPIDIASGPDGQIWFCVFANTASNQFYAAFIPQAPPFTGPFVVNEYANVIDPNAFANLVTIFPGPDGNLWMAEGGGAVKIPPAAPRTAVAEFFTDNGQTTMNKCIGGPDGNLWCTATGSPALGQGFIATADSIVTWVPR